METQMIILNDEKYIFQETLGNCDIAKVESTASPHKPAITFNRTKLYVNAEFIKCMPEMVYAQFLVDRAAKKLILRLCDKWELDSVRIRTSSECSPKPRQIQAAEFNIHLFEYMSWDEKYRYKVTGTMVNNDTEALMVFNLIFAEKYEMSTKMKNCCFETKGSFGITALEHQKNPIVRQFTEDTVIDVNIQDNKVEEISK